MALFCFVNSKSQIFGPYPPEDLSVRIDKNEFSKEALIWWHGQRQWLPIADWKDHVASILATEEKAAQTLIWHVFHDDLTTGPLSRKEMLELLGSLNALHGVSAQSSAMAQPKPVFELKDVIAQLGVDRRQTERTPLIGKATISVINRAIAPLRLTVAEISLGGAGVDGGHALLTGDQVKIVIESENLPASLDASAEVIYVSRLGIVGLRFTELAPETRELIEAYVRRFTS